MTSAHWTTRILVGASAAPAPVPHEPVQAAAAAPSIVGSRIGAYLITKRLGEGGVGEVFKGVDVMLKREVAIKVLRDELASDPLFLERFRVEAQLHAKLSHANVAAVHAFLHEGDKQVMVMEYVAGVALDEFVRSGGPVPVERALGIFRRALDGIAHAHASGIVHRDIKPANIMLADNGQVKVMDFGIARAMDSQEHLTRHGQVVGTAKAMAPEQIRGGQADARSDIYSLGIVLYTMLAGRAPFDGDNDHALMIAQLQQAPAPLHTLVADVPPKVEAAVMRALEKSPAARFQTVREFAVAIDACLADLATATPALPERPGAQTLSRTVINPVVHGATRLPGRRTLRFALPRWLTSGVGTAAPALLAVVASGVLLLADRSPADDAGASSSPPPLQAVVVAPAPPPPVSVVQEPAAPAVEPLPAPAPTPMPSAIDNSIAVVPPLQLAITAAGNVATNDDTLRLRSGERIRLQVAASSDAHVYCYLQDESKRIVRFYPNRFSPSARVTAAEPLQIPGRMRFELVVNRKKVQETVACFAADRDLIDELPAAVVGTDFASLPVASLDEVGRAFARLAPDALAQARLRVQPR